MSVFALPEDRTDTATMLRDLEQSCPRTTPTNVKAALVTAAKELEDWKSTAEDCVKMLEEAHALRVGQMDSHSRVDEIARQIKRAMSDAALKLRARMS
jgi:hypothetical protein